MLQNIKNICLYRKQILFEYNEKYNQISNIVKKINLDKKNLNLITSTSFFPEKYKQIIIDSVDKSYDKTELTKLIKEYTELKLQSIILNGLDRLIEKRYVKNDCPTCYEKNNTSAFVPCGHTICNDCIKVMTKNKSDNIKCPICQQKSTQIIKLYYN